MARSRKKAPEKRPIFDSIRKPVAPPTRRFADDAAREEKVHPALRKVKHKHRPDTESE